MDTVGGFNVNYFHPVDILSHFENHPNILRDKRGMELFCGFVWSNCLMAVVQEPFWVGVLMNQVRKHEDPQRGLSLSEVLKNPQLVDDTDCDVVVATVTPKPEYFYRCQITRLVSDFVSQKKGPDVFQLLEKKLTVQDDQALTLLINIEDRTNIDGEAIIEFLEDWKLPIPYREIVALGKSSDSQWKWQCFRIHPGLGQSEDLDLTEWTRFFPPPK